MFLRHAIIIEKRRDLEYFAYAHDMNHRLVSFNYCNDFTNKRKSNWSILNKHSVLFTLRSDSEFYRFNDVLEALIDTDVSNSWSFKPKILVSI